MENSLQTFVLSCAAIGVAWWRGFYSDLFLLFYFTVAVMQLDEFFLWRNMDNKAWNRFFTMGAGIILMAQPLVAMHLLHNTSLLQGVFYPLYGIFALVVTYRLLQKRTPVQTVKKRGHLFWDFFDNNEWERRICVVLYYFLLLSPFVVEAWWVALATGVGTLLVAYLVYGDVYPSLWCWSLNVFSIYVLLYGLWF